MSSKQNSLAYRWLIIPANCFAMFGGFIMLVLINMSLVSIIGRKLFSKPVPGDIELMEIGVAVAVATFLPICELKGGHIKVDAFTLKMPFCYRYFLDCVSHFVCFLVALVLTYRTALQTIDNYQYGDMSTMLSIPLWIPLGLIVPSLALLALCALARICELRFRGEIKII